ncbi:hypothetical protein KY290_003793 [Solanum tuberosum]|uniref:Uncharacterized protein n=1 Tax=Solanum tuberosum TaxID=4113 RepID=A0ABQ7WTX2_SOLTU|nr:hypothetical protein KY289_004137 [Solanum tuberosum]KAH0784195.1 hypothetical protein KY290_003793 [Solanum tuberosum]
MARRGEPFSPFFTEARQSQKGGHMVIRVLFLLAIASPRVSSPRVAAPLRLFPSLPRVSSPPSSHELLPAARSTFNSGITRHKQHLVGGFKNVKQCTACPSVIREEVRAYMQNKIANNPKFQVRQPEEYIDIDDVDDMDEYAEMMPPSKTPMISSSGGASSTARKGPMNLYFPQKSTQKGGFEKEEELMKQKKF